MDTAILTTQEWTLDFYYLLQSKYSLFDSPFNHCRNVCHENVPQKGLMAKYTIKMNKLTGGMSTFRISSIVFSGDSCK